MTNRLVSLATLAFAAVVGACLADEPSNAPRHTAVTPPPPSNPTALPTAPNPVPPPPVDDCAGRPVCDSFESGTVGSAPGAPWKPSPGAGGAVVVSSDRAYRGTKSVKLTTGATQYQRAMFDLDGAPFFPVTGNDLYGRMMVWLEQPAADGVHWTMFDGVGKLPNDASVTAHVRYGGQHQGKLMANYDTTGKSTDCWQHSQTAMPIKAWTCFTFRLHAATNEMEITMNTAPIADLHVTGSGQGCLGNDLGGQWTQPTYAKASVGWESYQQDVAHTMYLDDVVLDAVPIACPPPP